MKFDRGIHVYMTREGQRWDLAGHRIQFDADKTASPSENRGTVRIYNLGQELRRALAARHSGTQAGPATHVFVSAGYDGKLSLALRGEVHKATNTRSGPDWITELELITGIQAITLAEANISFAKPTPARRILDAIFEAMHWGPARYVKEAVERLGAAPLQDGCYSGNAAQLATTLLAAFKLTWTLDDDGITVFVPGKPSLPVQELNEDTGLIGTPQITERGITAQILLDPTLKPGAEVSIRSRTLSELFDTQVERYLVTELRHSGDTHGPAWSTTLQGVYASGVKPKRIAIEAPPPFLGTIL